MKKLLPQELEKETNSAIKKAYITFAVVFVGLILVAVALYFLLKAVLEQNSTMATALLNKSFRFWFWKHWLIILGSFVLVGMAIYAVKHLDVKRIWAIAAVFALLVSLGYMTYEYVRFYKDVSYRDYVVYEGEYCFFAESFSIRHNNRGDSVKLLEGGSKKLLAVDDFCETGRYQGKVTYLRRSGYVISVSVNKVLE